MEQRTVFGLSAMLAVGLLSLPDSINAQQKSLREQLIGAWTLVSCDGPYCGTLTNPNGILIIDGSGRYASVFASRGRPKISTVNRQALPAEEYKAAAMGFLAQFGTWSVNEADKTITYHIDGTLFPNLEGLDGKVAVDLSGDELKLIGSSAQTATAQKLEEVYRRAK
jgi:hypothetical protein